eukprot:gene30234-36538_t
MARRPRKANKHFDRKYGENFIAELPSSRFKRMFRMSRESFEKLENLVGQRLQVDQQHAINASGSAISIRTRLACTLRWLAGGSYHDIAGLFGVDPGNFFHPRGPLWPTVTAINSIFEIGLSLDPDNLEKTAKGFARYSHGRMRNCVMAVDGWVCKTRQPTYEECGGVISSYRNRKQCWAIVVLAGCDPQCRFTLFNPNNSGATNDVMAWERSALKTCLDGNELPEQYYFVGDEAFVCKEQFLTPWGGNGIGRAKDTFNYYLSSMRQCIERAFGILTRRWGIFWRPLNVQFNEWANICNVCAKLHNFCIDEGDVDPSPRHYEDHIQGDRWEVLDNNDEDAIGPRAACQRRTNITNELFEQGVIRPMHAKATSKE